LSLKRASAGKKRAKKKIKKKKKGKKYKRSEVPLWNDSYIGRVVGVTNKT